MPTVLARLLLGYRVRRPPQSLERLTSRARPRSRVPLSACCWTPGMEMVLKNESIVEPLAAQAIRLGADLLEVEYKDGYEQVFATRAGVRHCQVVEFQPGSRHVAKGT